uniref:Uncharacterized protein n=1 Tax=Sorghum bicolor TaxID=4558 RepID=C6JSR1_SORBI
MEEGGSAKLTLLRVVFEDAPVFFMMSSRGCASSSSPSWCNGARIIRIDVARQDDRANGAWVTGVPMVGVPQWTDQPMNAEYVEAMSAPDGLVRRGEVARGIEEVMDDDRSAEYRSLKTLSRS